MNSSVTPFRRTTLAGAILLISAGFTEQVASQDLILEEVIVTAQKRASTLQDISATVNVVTGDAIEKFASFNFAEIEEQTAGMTLSQPNARNASVSMRGIGTDPEAGTAAAVDVYWNEMPVRHDVAFTQLYDLERLEILRGPQGTLQGRTSPAGAINIITRSPNMDVADGSVSASVSDNDGLNGQFGYGAPLIEGVLGVRVAGAYNTDNSRDVENITTGLDDPEAESKSARVSIGWTPNEVFDATFTWQWLDQDVDDPKAIVGTDALGERPTLDDDDKVALGKTSNFGELEYDIYSLRMNLAIGDSLELTSVTGINDVDKFAQTENDRANYITNPEGPTHQNSRTETDSITQELRLASLDNDFWDWMIGVYYQDQDTDTTFAANTVLTAGLPDVGFQTVGTIPVDSEQLSLFTFNTFQVTDLVSVEFGLRWSDYESFRRADVNFGEITYPTPSFTEEQLEPLFASAFPIIAISEENEEGDEDAWTGSLTLRYEWTDNTSLYAGYNRGYRRGGISIVPDPDVQFLPNGEGDLLYDEEESDSLELGFKSRLLDGRASLNGAIYYQQFDGYLGFVRELQVLDGSGNPVDLSGGLVFNGDANIWGAELEGQMLLTETWSAGGALSYSKGEWDGAEQPCNDREPGEVFGSCDIDGEDVGGEPDWSASLNSEYFFPIGDMQLYIRGLYKYTGERNNIDGSAGIGTVVDEFEEHHIVNLYTGLRSADYRWDVSVWAKNLLDSDEVILHTSPDQYDAALAGGSYDQTNIQQERTIGGTVRYNF